MRARLQQRPDAPFKCPYITGQTARLYSTNRAPTQSEFSALLQSGWVFTIPAGAATRTECGSCHACWRIRVKAREYAPNRSQLRAQRANQDTRLVIGSPTIDKARVDLYTRHHLARQSERGWNPAILSGEEFIGLATRCPVPMLEFAFYRDGKVVAISYIADLVDTMFGIYFFYDPDYRHLSLGTWMVMSMIYEAAARGFDYAYLGTYVAGCGSLEYKGAFSPNQVRKPAGEWENFK